MVDFIQIFVDKETVQVEEKMWLYDEGMNFV